MPIHPPHAHLFNSVNLEVAKAKLGHAGRKSLYAPLNLVAYIDMMTMLVIFLLMSFSATGEILFVQKNIVLPDAQNWTDLERAPVIGVSKDVVTLDGSQVATADDLMKDSSTGDFKIAELHDKLVTLKNNYKLLHPGEEFNGIAIVQSDKNVEFKALKKVMYSIAVAVGVILLIIVGIAFHVRSENDDDSGAAPSRSSQAPSTQSTAAAAHPANPPKIRKHFRCEGSTFNLSKPPFRRFGYLAQSNPSPNS